MEFNDLKNRFKSTRAPEKVALDHIDDDAGGNSLFTQIKKNNARQIKAIKGFLYIMPISAVILVLLLFVNPDPDLTFSHRLTGGFAVIAFILYMPYAYKWYMLLKATQMGLPMRKFLEISEMRLRFWHKDSWVMIPYSLLVCGALNTTVMGNYWPENWSTLGGYLLVNIGFLSLLVYAYWSSYRAWLKDKKSLHDQVVELIKDLDSD